MPCAGLAGRAEKPDGTVTLKDDGDGRNMAGQRKAVSKADRGHTPVPGGINVRRLQNSAPPRAETLSCWSARTARGAPGASIRGTQHVSDRFLGIPDGGRRGWRGTFLGVVNCSVVGKWFSAVWCM
jgi:hypothetical protein